MALEELKYQIYACRKCRLWQEAKHGVPGEGPINAKIMLMDRTQEWKKMKLEDLLLEKRENTLPKSFQSRE